MIILKIYIHQWNLLRIPGGFAKDFFDRIQTLKRMAFSIAGTPNLPLSVSLPPTWNKKKTIEAFNMFRSVEFPDVHTKVSECFVMEIRNFRNQHNNQKWRDNVQCLMK